MNHLMKTNRFHGYRDAEIVYVPSRTVETKETKYFIIQERELNYRFYLHQHPYIQPLMQRQLRKGTAGLQAADTEYAPDGASLPGSIEIALGNNRKLTIPGGSKIALLTKAQAIANGVPIELEPGEKQTWELKVANPVLVTLPEGMKATLVEGMTNTPCAGAEFTPPPESKAIVSGDTKITLPSNTTIILFDDARATTVGDVEVLLVGGNELTIPNGLKVKLLKSKQRPVSDLYSNFFEAAYKPNAPLVRRPYPVKDLDFSSSGAYALYNWELFFHVPITIAIHLSKNQRFAEAQRWFHFLFDPTDDSDGPTPERFWKVRPFQYTDVRKIEEILVNLATGADEDLRNETIHSIEAWKDAPFRPHVIARYRQQAYMYKTVMAYLDNLIAWGDSLFRQDTGEAIDEAMMLYVLAANILGPRPQPVPKKGTVRPQTYANLQQDLSQFGTVMRDIEAALPYDLMPFPADGSGDNDRLATLRSLGKALYFCVPRNDKLLSYWDTVADRLFKIRNSLNIQGVFRQLALFEPPIDPAMLARAAAAGLDVGAIINGVNQPLPLVRFQFLVQKAAEIVQEVKSLGNNLLSVMEKEDGEAMAILRAKHEGVMMEMVEHVRYAQHQEAIKAKEGLLKSLALAIERYTFYERQLGRNVEDIEKSIPELGELDKESLTKMKFAMQEPEMAPREIEVDIATDVVAQAARRLLSGGKLLSSHEVRETILLEAGQLASDTANLLSFFSSFAHAFPTAKIHVQPWGVGGTVEYGGKDIGYALGALSTGARAIAERANFEARRASRIDSFARREREWAFQSNLAAGEITQIFKQLRATQIREAIAEQELKNHRKQMEHAKEIERFLNEEGTEKTGKQTNKALYAWMKREVKGLYSQCFQFAFDIAKKAERALQHELGKPELSFLQFGYLAGKEGLLAGEKLYLDVKRMEMAYHELNQREYELTKHVSLLQVNPLALLQLRATGRCTVFLPEELFDMDGPGHYFRRIKNLAVSIPCVTGPYTSVNCTLTLLKSAIRKNPLLRDGSYAREGAEDERFSDHFGSMQTIVTSTGQNDSGLFETNLRDERYLPFENSGVISEWQLELPADVRQFDYDTISDVILHIRYTAREGGGLLRNGAVANLQTRIAEAQTAGSVRLFSVRHEFPSEWAKFKNVKFEDDTKPAELALNLSEEHYPFWSRASKPLALNRVEVIARPNNETAPAKKTKDTITIFDKSDDEPAGTRMEDKLERVPSLNNFRRGELKKIPKPPATGKFSLYFDDNSMNDLWLAVTWGKGGN